MTRLSAPWAMVCAMALATCVCVHAAPVTPERITALCAQAEGPAHCGRLIEAEQLKALPNLAIRDGETLKVTLFPTGTREFIDVDSPQGGTTWSLWDYWSPVNVAVLFTTDRDRIGYVTLQRTSGQVSALPAEPLLSPDRQRFAVADFCSADCDNEISVWRVARDGIRKEYGWKPNSEWTDVTVQWSSAEALKIEFTPAGQDKPKTLERRLTDADWQQPGSRTAP